MSYVKKKKSHRRTIDIQRVLNIKADLNPVSGKAVRERLSNFANLEAVYL